MAFAPASNGASDITPPTLVQMINALPATMNAGDYGGVTAQITDDLSGVKSASLLLTNPAGTGRLYRFTLTSGDQLDGEYAAVVTLPNPAVTGTWTVDLQPSRTTRSTRRASSRLPGTIAVGGTSDTTPPSLDSFSLDKTTTSDLANGPDTVTATLQISDAGSGLSLCQVTLIAPSANQQVHKDVFCNGSVATAVFQLPRYSRPGTWKPFVTLFDKAGNHASYVPSGSDLEVVDSNPDTTPPTLGNFSVSPAAVDAGETPQFVSVTAGSGGDNLSGISSITIRYDSPSRVQSVETTRLGFPADHRNSTVRRGGKLDGIRGCLRPRRQRGPVRPAAHRREQYRLGQSQSRRSAVHDGPERDGGNPYQSRSGGDLHPGRRAQRRAGLDSHHDDDHGAAPGFGLFPLEFDITAPDQSFETPLEIHVRALQLLDPASGRLGDSGVPQREPSCWLAPAPHKRCPIRAWRAEPCSSTTTPRSPS